MGWSPVGAAVRHLLRAVEGRGGAALTDGQLLTAFVERRDEAAFAALVNRHGRMVWGTCRRLLGHHDAEDAYQAAFLVLYRKAAAVAPRDLVGNWLHGVALRAALQARRALARRRAREQAVPLPPDAGKPDPVPAADLALLLDRELSRLPAGYRAAVVVCDLEGQTRKEAARRLGWPEGTVAGRLARARSLLARRLARQGLPVAAGTLAGALAPSATAGGPPLTIMLGAVPPAVAVLTKGVVQGMLVNQIKLVLTLVVALGLVAGAGTLLGRPVGAAGQEPTRPAAKPAEPPITHPRAAPMDVEKMLLHGEWTGADGGERITLFFGPENRAELFVEGDRHLQGTYTLNWGTDPLALDLRWEGLGVAQTILSFPRVNELRMARCVMDNPERPKAVTDQDPLFTRKVPPAVPTDAAQKDLNVAAFYHRAGKFGPAAFHYALVQRRYPGTPQAEQAARGLAELARHRVRLADGSEGWAETASAQAAPPAEHPESATLQRLQAQIATLERRLGEMEAKQEPPPLRVGQVFIAGNTKTPTAVILAKVQLMPGQILDFRALEATEKALAAWRGKVRMEGTAAGPFLDLIITVQE
jgi:RNA polymerase sigma factor (sigma-70 family)